MAPKRNSQATSAEISLTHLKTCLVNLPASLVPLLVSVNIPIQNVVVELNYRIPLPPGTSQTNGAPNNRSIFVGWTGMQSKRKLAPIVNRDGISGTRGNTNREQDVSLVEIDATFARTLGLADGQKITATLHMDPLVAHTVNIEPLTADDWEIIELHANFLEFNFIHQVRALPNPSYASSGSTSAPHPLTLHLSPTSTANIIVTSLIPVLSPNSPFAKLSPDAEVIVAPKTRSRPTASYGENRSVTSRKSAGGRSTGGRSGTSTVRRRSGQEEKRPAMFFRGLGRSACEDLFDEGSDSQDDGLKVWVDRDVLFSKALKGITWACVTLVKPPSLQNPVDPQKLQQELETMRDVGKLASKVVARLLPWDDPPDSQHAALSSSLSAAMSREGFVGGVVKLEAAPTQIERIERNGSQVIKIYPFATGKGKVSEGLKFGGETNAEREESSKRLFKMYGGQDDCDGIFDGPLTNGVVLGTPNMPTAGWEGGILRFDHRTPESSSKTCHWFLGSERKISIEVQPPIPKPLSVSSSAIGDPLAPIAPILVGIDNLIEKLQSHLSHMSSVLLTGALGSGKSSVAHLLAHKLRSESLFHTTYFSCRKLVNHETQVSAIKETFTRLFMDACWGARLGGKSIVVLDDLDKLCPAETELEVGNDNGRSRQISEGICSVVKQFCGRDSNIVLLATAQAKESLHNVIVGGHVVREIIGLKAPNKEARRRVVELVVRQNASDPNPHEERANTDSRSNTDSRANTDSRPTTADGSVAEGEDTWMDGGSVAGRATSNEKPDGLMISPDLDFLDLSGETDGYMPGDLVLLVSRARSEALIRSVSDSPNNIESATIYLTRADFDSALKGFTPASLRNVTLQTSTTTFASIGGLHETRKVLLETLQYPTTYAPIFAQCPLRLRSGLLLYGYPGCGKTMLASAVAGECGLNFISVKGPEILNKYIGASEKSVRDLFERAEAARPCVLFFDEFDSIAPKRGHDSTGVTDRVVNQLLTQMDGAEGLSGVYVLAATSRPDLIDPALLRPGRLDKSLICDLPDLDDRIDILKALGKKLKLSEEVIEALPDIANRCEGYSGADLQALIYNAHLEAIHDVLGDQDHTEVGTKKTNGTNGTTSAARNFIQFRYGQSEDLAESEARSRGGHNKSELLAERAAISSKLAEIKAAKKRAKAAQRGIVSIEKAPKVEKEQEEVIIAWRHVEKSLGSTRASISAQDRVRLQAIYREFVVGRSGDMKNGEGARDVGGRTSLM
ncbi:hypothetical protein HYALB_00002171 [Hymenoscyphus albidus]|uniref:Peroxisomal ATPase PEX1 n=1 Tax=Hymenoscyphus albidus TaxID=595503 RepID=A0A9N9LJM6_9HELO|nr:hypothetical protein HYALB_00002171 [Hymenoscyphus albidus]